MRCYGDGGALFTNNDEWEQLLQSYIAHGKGKDKYDNVRIGMNSRLDTLQAQYTVCFCDSEERRSVIKILDENGIPTEAYYRIPMYLQKTFMKYRIFELDYCVTEKCAAAVCLCRCIRI